MNTRVARRSLLLAVLLLGLLSSLFPALALEEGGSKDATKATKKDADAAGLETAEPMIATYAWYWKDQKQQKITNPTDGSDAATLELKNPYCPDTSPAGSPPDQVCHEGRLPVEVRDDYSEPAKLSAINFDLAIVPPGSKVTKFTVRLWEAQDGFSRSTQYNLDGKKVQACVVEKIFGEGEARLYSEVPKYKCSKGDAIATRKSTKLDDATETEAFYWDLDLTKQAQEWVKKGVFATSVLLHPVEPKNASAQEQAWQVVFAGPREEKYGIDTKIVFDAAELAPPPPPPPPPPPLATENDPLMNDTTTSFGTGSSTPTTTTTSDFGTDSTAGAPTSGAVEEGAGEETADPTLAADDAALAADEQETVPSGMPFYMWLAILAGILGFTMVRSVVLEKNTGIRPDGVLAQIQRLNAQRRGTSAATAVGGSSAFAALTAGLGAIGSKISAGAGKLVQLVSKKKG